MKQCSVVNLGKVQRVGQVNVPAQNGPNVGISRSNTLSSTLIKHVTDVCGPSGATGATGATGPQGDPGENGKAAYVTLFETGYFSLGNVDEGPTGNESDVPENLDLTDNIQYVPISTNTSTLAQLSTNSTILGPASVVTQISGTSIVTASGRHRVFFFFDTAAWSEPFDKMYVKLSYFSDEAGVIITQPDNSSSSAQYQEIPLQDDGTAYWATEVDGQLIGQGTLSILFTLVVE